MRKSFILWTILITTIFLLAACSDDKEKESEEPATEEASEGTGTEEEDDAEETEEESEEATDEDEMLEDQLDLSVGDTGSFDSTLGTYDMTLDDVEIIEDELEGEKSTRDAFILLDVTIKNTSDHALDLEDLIVSMEVTANLDHSGSSDHAAGFDTIEEFTGDLEPGEEASAQFLTIIDDSDEYYFRKMVGNIGAGYSNQVVWTISLEDAE